MITHCKRLMRVFKLSKKLSSIVVWMQHRKLISQKWYISKQKRIHFLSKQSKPFPSVSSSVKLLELFYIIYASKRTWFLCTGILFIAMSVWSILTCKDEASEEFSCLPISRLMTREWPEKRCICGRSSRRDSLCNLGGFSCIVQGILQGQL